MKNYLHKQFDINQSISCLDELPLWSAPFGMKILDTIDYKENISVLDIGFGTGFPILEIAMRLGNSSTVYGIDPWKEAIERCKEKLAFYDIHNVKLIESKAETIPLESNSIDLVTSNNGINNVTDIPCVLHECARVLRQGGQFIQTMNTDKTMHEFYTLLEKAMLEFNLKDRLAMMHQHIEQKRPKADKITALMEESGFNISSVEHDEFRYKFANGTGMLNHYFIRLAFMDSWKKLLPKDKIEEIFDYIEVHLNALAKEKGGINLTIPFVTIDARKQ